MNLTTSISPLPPERAPARSAATGREGREPGRRSASVHLLPLLCAVGAADDPGSAVSAIDRMVMGNSTRSLQLT
ncbi:hypothetical protein [Streptomyces smaragdinus]|uniref:hypothetical protein n=1 Tax=Streptomyces smaragdinus TaxID=2585196 RepID=UPI001E4C4997|nr:hypothetical protein [Streptomyces smaragdinus]